MERKSKKYSDVSKNYETYASVGVIIAEGNEISFFRFDHRQPFFHSPPPSVSFFVLPRDIVPSNELLEILSGHLIACFLEEIFIIFFFLEVENAQHSFSQGLFR